MYAGDHVLAKVLEERDDFLSSRPSSVELTMLFYDIAWFEAAREDIDAESLYVWSKSLGSVVTDTVKKSGGTFDTFVGDAGSAWWGANGAPRHAERAFDCATQLVAGVEKLNQQSREARLPVVGLMIGIHTGLANLGNFGSASRIRYCPMGDAVNLAARLCGLAPKYSVPIVLSEATYRASDKPEAAQYLGRVPVKGGDAEVAIYGAGTVEGVHAF